MSIRKIIHYCWFGNGELPQKEKQCIESWKTYFPDYEFQLWNEENFNYQACNFAKQAYEHKKYAFVSDYARAKILYEYGGLYLDTDVKVLKDFRNLLENIDAVAGFERKAFVGTAVIGCQKHDKIIKKLLEYYETHEFVQADGSFDNIANVSILTDILKDNGLILGGAEQRVDGYQIYNREMFYPKKMNETDFQVTVNTVAIHMCSNSWLSERERRRGNNKFWIEVVRPILRQLRAIGIKCVGKERIRKIEIKIRNMIR